MSSSQSFAYWLEQVGGSAARHKRLVVIALTTCFIAGGLLGITLPKRYTATVDVMLANKKQASASFGSLGDLAGVAGVALGGSSSQEPLAILKSKSLARKFLLESGALTLVIGVGAGESNTGELASAGESARVLNEAAIYLQKQVITVAENAKTGVISVSATWRNPQVAAMWANDFVRSLNDRMRNDAILESERTIAFLKQEISNNQVLAVQQSIGRVLEGELQRLALARAKDEFALKTIDQATPPRNSRMARALEFSLVSMGLCLVVLVIVFLLDKAYHVFLVSRP